MALRSQRLAGPSPAQVYEELFVPAVFGPWADVVAAEAAVQPGDRVLDVACGTGALACAAARRAGPEGRVVGLDPNPEMLAEARRKATPIVWQAGSAEAIPFPDASFDVVVSQFGMMFFADRVAALREMLRVLPPDGRLAVAVIDAVDRSPGYATLAGLLERLFGSTVAEAFRAPFVLGDEQQLRDLCEAAGVGGAELVRRASLVRFASIADLVTAEQACVWTLGGLLDDEQFARLLAEAETALRPFVTADGAVEFAMPALIIRSGLRPARQSAGARGAGRGA